MGRAVPALLIVAAGLAPLAARAEPAGRTGDDCGLEPPEVAEQAPPAGERAAGARTPAPDASGWGPVVRRADASAVAGVAPAGGRTLARPFGDGALAGKTIYLSAGHGWVWDDGLGRWRTQRGNTHDLVEDFISIETIAQHLIPYLHDMGAYVVPVREASMQRVLVLADDGDAGFTVEGATATAVADGWSPPAGPLTGTANPFDGGGSVTLPAAGGGVARWALDVAEPGDYEVYVAWVQGPDRAADAHYAIHHAGGTRHVLVDQRRHGSTWVLLGRFHFDPGDPGAAGGGAAVELIADSADAAAVVSADAVRLGGGTGHVDRGGGASDRPAFESGARYAAQYNGAPSTVWDYAAADGNDDVGTRSRFSAWDHEDGEDAVYVAWHTNAPSPARGTSSFAYGPDAYGDLSQFTGVPGSLELMDAIHTELIEDFRAAWQVDWQDRGQHTAYFGEVNPSHNPEMPAALIEVAFHDTAEDAAALRDPRFRRIAARAFAHGIARYFAARDGAPLTLPPEPPAAARMTQDPASDGLVVAWDAPDVDPAGGDPATGYRVYLSRDGRAFDDGVAVDGTSLTIAADDPRLAGGGPVFARVTATNAGGESRPSPVVGAAPSWGRTVVLVVAGFTRIDGAMLFDEDLSFASLGNVERAYEDRINDESHGARHGLAAHGAGYAFDVVTAEAVRRGAVALDGYAAVSWLAGEELEPLTEGDRAAVAAYLDGGGALIVSGTDVARALAAGAGDAAALLARLGVALVADDAGTYAVAGVPGASGAAFEGLALDFADDGPGGYDADAADALDAAGAGAVALAYDTGAGAGVVAVDPVAGRSLVLGFPIETVSTAEARTELMRRALGALAVEPGELACPHAEGCDEDDDGGGLTSGCCSATGGPGAGSIVLAVLVAGAVLTRRRRPSRLQPSCPR